MTTQTLVETLVVLHCYKCHCAFGITQDHYERARRSSSVDFYCPNGHGQVFTKTREQELEEKLRMQRNRAERAETSRQMWRDQAEAAERSKRALKGHLTRARNKIAAGDCPVPDCGLHFANVREHMKHKHPGWHLTDPETGKPAQL
jgi:hypothetical protein